MNMVRVEIWKSIRNMPLIGRDLGLVRKGRDGCVAVYDMDYRSAHDRRTLGEQVKNAIEAGQVVVTIPYGQDGVIP